MDDTTVSAIGLNNDLSCKSQNERDPHPDSQTASDYIDTQLRLEADAREALPYAFDHCTQSLGPLRQNLYSCLTCRPPPDSPSESYTPAAVCYSCSIACHGEHTLVELFNRRNFTCDCGSTRLPSESSCTLRIDPATGFKGPVHSQPAAEGNTYNQNFRNRFCGCGEIYNAHAEKGTMFQCLGLATEADGGCGEDWWHRECIVGLGRDWSHSTKSEPKSENAAEEDGEDESPLPPGFPEEDAFETFICYKCADAHPWLRRYAGSEGFLPPVHKQKQERHEERRTEHSNNFDETKQAPRELELSSTSDAPSSSEHQGLSEQSIASNKRKASEGPNESPTKSDSKRTKVAPPTSLDSCKYSSLPSPPLGQFSLFLKQDFRNHICRCASCYPSLSAHPQLLDEEESYVPPLSEDGDEDNRSAGTGSLLDRGEAALSNVDRVRAIEGVMVYNHLKDKVKNFLQPFAESGQAVGAEDIKAYFEKLRGDEQGIKSAQAVAAGGDGTGEGGNRREQSGY